MWDNALPHTAVWGLHGGKPRAFLLKKGKIMANFCKNACFRVFLLTEFRSHNSCQTHRIQNSRLSRYCSSSHSGRIYQQVIILDSGICRRQLQSRFSFKRFGISFGLKSTEDTTDSPSRIHKKINNAKVIGLQRNHRRERPIQKIICSYQYKKEIIF